MDQVEMNFATQEQMAKLLDGHNRMARNFDAFIAEMRTFQAEVKGLREDFQRSRDQENAIQAEVKGLRGDFQQSRDDERKFRAEIMEFRGEVKAQLGFFKGLGTAVGLAILFGALSVIWNNSPLNPSRSTIDARLERIETTMQRFFTEATAKR